MWRTAVTKLLVKKLNGVKLESSKKEQLVAWANSKILQVTETAQLCHFGLFHKRLIFSVRTEQTPAREK